MIELGDLVVFSPCYNVNDPASSGYTYRKLKQHVSCGVVIDRFTKKESTILKIVFPEGSYNMDIGQVSTVSKWYVGSPNKL